MVAGRTSAIQIGSMARPFGSTLSQTSRSFMCHTSFQVRCLFLFPTSTSVVEVFSYIVWLPGAKRLIPYNRLHTSYAGENGGRSDTRWVALSDETGAGFAAISLTSSMQIMATRFGPACTFNEVSWYYTTHMHIFPTPKEGAGTVKQL